MFGRMVAAECLPKCFFKKLKMIQMWFMGNTTGKATLTALRELFINDL